MKVGRWMSLCFFLCAKMLEGSLDEKGLPADTRTEAQKASMYALLKELTEEYPEARIMGHCELPHVAKSCPCFQASTYFASLQPDTNQ